MTNQEFSDGFSTLLNSYNTQALFGELASLAEITLDEYEKSVFLTQAQDMIVKQYFDVRTDEVQEGFDGSERRQADFSNLITVKTLELVHTTSQKVLVTDPKNGTLGTLKFTLKATHSEDPYDIKSCKVILKIIEDDSISSVSLKGSSPSNGDFVFTIYMTINELQNINNGYANLSAVEKFWDFINIDGNDHFSGPLKDIIDIEILYNTGNVISTSSNEPLVTATMQQLTDYETFDDRGMLFELPDKLLFMLNEKLEVTTGGQKKKYVVIPINYREYDRENSKPYSQPYKKQCWRLFQNILGFDTLSEIIPVWDAVKTNSVVNYKIRYVRRPQPIVLVNLPDDLKIDNENKETECELNKVLHMDILNKAFELATATRGGTPGATQQRRRRSNSDNED